MRRQHDVGPTGRKLSHSLDNRSSLFGMPAQDTRVMVAHGRLHRKRLDEPVPGQNLNLKTTGQRFVVIFVQLGCNCEKVEIFQAHPLDVWD